MMIEALTSRGAAGPLRFRWGGLEYVEVES